MPERRKQNKNFNTRVPSTYVHPSLGSSSKATSSAAENSPRSVNERIEYLRSIQPPPRTYAAEESRLPRLPLRPLRSAAGPAPPRSWTEGSDRGRTTLAWRINDNEAKVQRPRSTGYFPGAKLPHSLSLMHQTLKCLAAEFEGHVQYDHEYLSTLPVYIKETLLTYIAVYGSEESNVTLQGLRVLFAAADKSGIPESTGTDELSRLDLGGSIGRGLSLKQLGQYFVKPKSRDKTTPGEDDSTPDAWDDDKTPAPTSINSSLRFPLLTHLSLAHPGPNVSWAELLTFSKNHLGALTHLSLASWPAPTLPKTHAETPALTAQRRGQSDNTPSHEAASIMLQLSRHTPSLEFISFDGCQIWWQYLSEADTTYPVMPLTQSRSTTWQRPQWRGRLSTNDAFNDADQDHQPTQKYKFYDLYPWTSSWRHVSHISLKQGWLPHAPLVTPARLSNLHRERRTPGDPYVQPDAAREMERYTLSASSHAVRQSVEDSLRPRAWCIAEYYAAVLERNVRRIRRAASAMEERVGRGAARAGISAKLHVEHGWDKDVLVDEGGYDEGELFDAGL